MLTDTEIFLRTKEIGIKLAHEYSYKKVSEKFLSLIGSKIKSYFP